MERLRYQQGALYLEKRKSGLDVWVYRWREQGGEGKRLLRKKVVGTVRDYRTKVAAHQAAESLRLTANRERIGGVSRPQTFGELVEDYRLKEMPLNVHEGKTRGTKLVYNSILNHYVVPRWGKCSLFRISTIEVEIWLRSLELAPSSRTKIRNVMSMVFRHAIRWGWLGQQENPIAMVRSSTKRIQTPVILTVDEYCALLAALPERERLMGVLCATSGLRVGEVLGLKWKDIDFETQTADITRSFVDGSVGRCKTEISRQPVPLDQDVLEMLRDWRLVCGYPRADDWIFASRQNFGKTPMWPDSLRRKILQPAARRAGIAKRIGWHTFRHTYSSLLARTGNDVRVVQELMRHSKVSTTMEVYTHADMDKKRMAQKKAVDLLLDRGGKTEAEERKRA